MRSLKLPLCFYKTTTLLVDDDKEFVSLLERQLKKNKTIKSFLAPQKALDYLSVDAAQSNFIERCTIENEDDFSDQLTMTFDIRKLHTEAANPNHEEVAVIVVDYAMPEMNGIEFALKAKELCPNLKIVMLTGEADESLAVKAFNDGAIDKFILKSTEHLSQCILAAIIELQQRYFIDLSAKFVSSLKRKKETMLFLSDPLFSEKFLQITAENHITEYYLMNENGSFLLIDEAGVNSYFAVLSEAAVQDFYDYAQYENAPKEILDALKNRTHLLYFHTDEDLQLPPQQWQNKLYRAKRLDGNETYYYCYIDYINTAA